MRHPRSVLLALALVVLLPGSSAAKKCPADSVRVGPACVDRYEATVWSLPDSKKAVKKLLSGRLTVEKLLDLGGEQVGEIPDGTCSGEEYGPGFPNNGSWTAPLYAASLPGVLPSTCITWFQAEQACRLVGKRLATNQEWQAAAAGTPDPGENDDIATTCATKSPFAQPTGSRSQCVSVWGTYDMAGNVWEWVGDWMGAAQDCTTWTPEYGNDMSCMGAALPADPNAPASGGPQPRELQEFHPNLPGAVIRGGNFAAGERNGIFAVFSGVNPYNVSRSTGFRCARSAP